MASSKKVKKVYICPTCKGNGYVKVACIYEKEDMIHQCWDCESQGELYDYGDEDFSELEGEGMARQEGYQREMQRILRDSLMEKDLYILNGV